MSEERRDDAIDEEELPEAGNSKARIYPPIEEAEPGAESDLDEPQGQGAVPREGKDQAAATE
jgi:hypothetical protein